MTTREFMVGGRAQDYYQSHSLDVSCSWTDEDGVERCWKDGKLGLEAICKARSAGWLAVPPRTSAVRGSTAAPHVVVSQLQPRASGQRNNPPHHSSHEPAIGKHAIAVACIFYITCRPSSSRSAFFPFTRACLPITPCTSPSPPRCWQSQLHPPSHHLFYP